MTRVKPVVLGLGNLLFQDEGLGIHVIHQLMREDIARQADLLDGGTDSLALLTIVEESRYLLIIDAIDGAGPPGTIQVLEGDGIPLLLSSRLSPHQIGFQEVLALARLRGKTPPHTMLIGVQPRSLDWGTDLSPEVVRALPRVKTMIYRQIDRWQGGRPLF